MQTSSQCETIAVSQYVHSDGINNGGGLLVDQGALKSPSSNTPTPPGGAGSRDAIISLTPTANRMKMQTAMAPTHSNNEMADENSDSESESEYMTDDMMLPGQVHPQQAGSGGHPQQGKRPPDGLKPGKKTKGRVKIKMEFIENKLRRYTTFSKRKTGIMKKAYELSTLTGTQVMLLVASETGHVYTFATRKLQPMITSESGKALIQTCLNSPDSSADGPAHQQRMNPTGFEETELTYSVEDESKADIKPILAQMPGDQVLNRSQAPNVANPTGTSSSSSVYVSSAALTQAQMASLVPSTVSSSTTVTTSSSKPSVVVSNPSPNNGNPNSATNMQVPPGLTAIFQQGAQFTIPIQQGNQQLTQTAATPQTMYRLPNSQVVSIPNMPSNSSNGSLGSPTTVSGDTIQVVTPSTTPSSSSSSSTTTNNNNNNNNQNSVSFMSVPTTTGGSVTHGIVMYQTPQGVVYATPTTATLSDGSIFNFQQPAISVGNSTEQTAAGAQQIITIPVPLAGSQLLQFTTNSATDPASITELTQPSLPKKARKWPQH